MPFIKRMAENNLSNLDTPGYGQLITDGTQGGTDDQERRGADGRHRAPDEAAQGAQTAHRG